MKVRVGQGVLPTGVDTVDVTWSGAGTPDACIVICGGAITLNVNDNDQQGSIGFSDFTNEIAFGWGADNGVGSIDNSRCLGTGVIALNQHNSATIERTAVASAVTDGVRLTTGESGTAHLFMVIAFFGGEWAVIEELDNTEAITTEVNIAHTLSGEPNLGFFSMNEQASLDTASAPMEWCFGMFTNVSETIVQRAICMFATGDPTFAGGRSVTDRVAGAADSSGVMDTSVQITGIDDTNVTFTIRDSATAGDSWGGLVGLVNEAVELVTVDSPNDDTVDWNVNDASFTPQAVVGWMSEHDIEDQAENNDQAGTRAIFAVDDLGNNHSVAFGTDDGAGTGGSPTTTRETDRVSDDHVLLDVDKTIMYQWDNPTFTADGFDVASADIANVSPTGATTHKWPMLFIGLAAVAVGLATESDAALGVTLVGGEPTVELAVEVSTALGIDKQKVKSIVRAEEFDFSLQVNLLGAGAVVGLSDEVDTSLAAIAGKGYDVALSTEASSAFTVTPRKEWDAVKGIELDEALSAIVGISPILDITTETDTAFSVQGAKDVSVLQAVEVDTPLQVLFDTRLFVGLPEEVSVALPVTSFSLGLLGQSIEIDFALSAIPHRSTLIGLATEADSTFSVTIDTVQVPRDLGWEDDDVTWGGVEIGSKDFAPVYLTGQDFKILGYDSSTPLDAYVERRAVLSERGAIVLGTAIWPDIVGPTGQALQISMGAHDTPDGSVDWEGPYDFYIGQDEFVDFAVSGKYLAVRFAGTGVSAWALQSYDIDYEVVGRH